jgi:hypothetical protein
MRATIAAWRMCLGDEQGELVRRDKLALVKNPLNVLQEIELAPVAGRSGHLPLPLRPAAAPRPVSPSRAATSPAMRPSESSNRKGSGTQKGQVFSIDQKFSD